MNKNLWTDEEIEILEKYYKKFGAEYCSKLLINRTSRSCEIKANKLNIKFNRYEENNLKEIIKNSKTYSEVIIKLNLKYVRGNIRTLQKYIKLYNIDVSHFKITYGNNNLYNIDLKYILIENSTYLNIASLKNRLYKEGLKERKCELCGQGEEWQGKHMSLILDHINGKHDDNRLENLQIVCPNCNATLETHCRGFQKLEKMKLNNKPKKEEKNIIHKEKVIKAKKEKTIKYCECSKEISKDAKQCTECNRINSRKVERPSLEQLELDVEELGYCGTGRKYGVSDNAIRKWIKRYKE